MKKQLFLTALMSVTSFSAQAGDFGQATATYAKELGQATATFVRTSVDLTEAALIKTVTNSLPGSITWPIFWKGFREGQEYAHEYAHDAMINDLKFAGKLALFGAATYYTYKYLQQGRKDLRTSLNPSSDAKRKAGKIALTLSAPIFVKNVMELDNETTA